MDPLARILLRLAQWQRNPPSRRWVQIAVVTLIFVVVIVLIEKFVGWPDWLRTERVPIRRLP
jgi:hypothetical protein